LIVIIIIISAVIKGLRTLLSECHPVRQIELKQSWGCVLHTNLKYAGQNSIFAEYCFDHDEYLGAVVCREVGRT
jgi:hypothetical protein